MDRVLHDHTSQETAYVQPDYPYSFQLRCQRRVWLEFKAPHGYRMVTQTSNPKKTGVVWNKPKAGVYHFVAVLVVDDQDHIRLEAMSVYDIGHLDRVEAFFVQYAEGLQGTKEQAILRETRAAHARKAATRQLATAKA